MTELTLNIDNYITDEEKKQIALSVFEEKIRQDCERVLSNSCYTIAKGFVNEFINDEQRQYVKKTVAKLLSQPKSIEYSLFQRKDAWHPRRQFEIDEIIEGAIRDNREILIEKTIKALRNVDDELLSENIFNNFDRIIAAIISNLEGKK